MWMNTVDADLLKSKKMSVVKLATNTKRFFRFACLLACSLSTFGRMRAAAAAAAGPFQMLLIVTRRVSFDRLFLKLQPRLEAEEGWDMVGRGVVSLSGLVFMSPGPLLA
jgi:hypothetical protein